MVAVTVLTAVLMIVAMLLLLVFREMFFEPSCPMCGGSREHAPRCPFRKKPSRKDT